MQQRDYLQENQKDMGTSGTLSFNVDYTDPISEINLLFEATNGSDCNKDSPIERSITKIEIVDGGTVLWDLPGDVLLAHYTHLNQGLEHCYRSGAVSDSVWQSLNLRFGRFLYDPIFAFNPRAHKNPQLRITFDEATVRAAGTTGFLSDSFNLSILVKLMENAPSPVGFLSCREVETFTTADSGDKKVELPTDRVIRMLMIRTYLTAIHFSNNITKYKLSVDGGKFVPFDLYYRNMRDKMSKYFKPVLIPQYTKTDNQEWHQSWIGDGFYATIRAHQGTNIAGAESHSGGRFKVYHSTHAGVAVNGGAVHFAVCGIPFHNTLIYPFGRLNEPDEWFDARIANKLDLFLTQGDADAECNVCVQQVYRY